MSTRTITKTATTGRFTHVTGGKKEHGREVWVVTGGGKRQVIKTSASSVAAMDQAMTVYAGALERLAKK
jgi:hypothetical protein